MCDDERATRGQRSPRQRWGTCCPYDPECEHSYLDEDVLTRWLDTPINDSAARLIADLFGGGPDEIEETTCDR